METDILDDVFKEKKLPNKIPSKTGISIAKSSFVIGSILFIIALNVQNIGYMLSLGFIYLIGATMLNLVYFIYLLFKSGTPEERRSYWKAAGIMLLNIPIAFIYLYFILENVSGF